MFFCETAILCSDSLGKETIESSDDEGDKPTKTGTPSKPARMSSDGDRKRSTKNSPSVSACVIVPQQCKCQAKSERESRSLPQDKPHVPSVSSQVIKSTTPVTRKGSATPEKLANDGKKEAGATICSEIMNVLRHKSQESDSELSALIDEPPKAKKDSKSKEKVRGLAESLRRIDPNPLRNQKEQQHR
jgi:hypothetical protein